MLEGNGLKKLAHILGMAALLLIACILTLIALSALRLTTTSLVADNRMNQAAILRTDSLAPNLALTCALALSFAGLYALFERFAGVRFGAGALLLWMAVSVCFVLMVGLVPRADSYLVLDAAKKFAQGDYSPMHSVYFNRVSYQLGVCLLLEGICRLLPGADLNLVMQCLNCALSVGAAGVLCVLAERLARGTGRAALILYLAFLPMLLFNMFVYSVLPILLLCALAMLCFAQYARSRRRRYALAYALLIGVSMVIKPNTMIVMLALLICAALHALAERDGFMLLCALLSAVLCAVLPSGVIRLYELRSGVELAADTGMLLRLAMGMQDSVIAAGWYNGMIEEFWDLSVTPQAEAAAAAQMLGARLSEFAAEPAMAARFFAEKCLTQWLEPAYDMLWYGAACEKAGRFNGLAHAIFRDGSPLRALLEGYMNIFQQTMYALSALGLWRMIRSRRCGAAELMLPVSILGGFFYHMLFEAKSQYLYVYVMLMMPLAAQGLTLLTQKIKILKTAAKR